MELTCRRGLTHRYVQCYTKRPCLAHPTLRRLQHDQVQAPGLWRLAENKEQRLAGIGVYIVTILTRLGSSKSVVGVCSWRKKMVFPVFPSSMCRTDTSASASYSNTLPSDLPILTRHFDSSCLVTSLSSPTTLAHVHCGLPRHRD
jgi:hypothetical protein